mgnify:CR=1 FL=1
MSECLLELRGINKSFGGVNALTNINMKIYPGQVLCLAGENGCGKSTLLAHISRRLPSRNSIYYKGCAVETIPRKEYAKEVAVMVQQGFGMAGDLKAEDVVLMGRYPFKGRFSDYTKEDHQIAERVMIETGASILSGREMQHMSGGEKQRILIAKAFTQKPQLLLMDEPTNHLDVKYKLSLMEHLKRFHQQGTVIVVLHDLSLAARYCDHAVVMRAGKVIDFGKVENTITAEKMSRLFEVPFYKAVHEDQQFLYC